MKTKFDVGETILIKGTVKEIHIGEDKDITYIVEVFNWVNPITGVTTCIPVEEEKIKGQIYDV